jgi:hypothetical protein
MWPLLLLETAGHVLARLLRVSMVTRIALFHLQDAQQRNRLKSKRDLTIDELIIGQIVRLNAKRSTQRERRRSEELQQQEHHLRANSTGLS